MSLGRGGLSPKMRAVRLPIVSAHGPPRRKFGLFRCPFPAFPMDQVRWGAVRYAFQEAPWSFRQSSATRRPNLRAFSAVFSSGAPTQATP